MTDINHPATMIMFADSNWTMIAPGNNAQTYSMWADQRKQANRLNGVNGAHNLPPGEDPAYGNHSDRGMANIVFVDGHVESLSASNVNYSLDPAYTNLWTR